MSRAHRAWATGALALVASVSAVYGFQQVRHWPLGTSTWDVTLAWVAGLGCLVAIAALGADPTAGDDRPGFVARVRRWRPTSYDVAGLSILLVSAVARLVALDRFPTVIDGDEGGFLTQALLARHGDLPNPWGTGVQTQPDGYFAVSGRLAPLFGDGIAAYRVLSAVLGIVTVLAVWRLGRRVLGEIAGLVAMGALAFLPLHLWASRFGLNNVSHAATAALLLWALDRAVVDRRRSDAVAAGLVTGFAMYGYTGGLVFVGVALAVLVVVCLLPAYEAGLRATATIGGWLLLGWAVVAAPILGHYARTPDRLYGRFQEVEGPAATLGDRLGAAVRGVLYPVQEHEGLQFYRVDGPFLGWVLGPLAVAGAACWLIWTGQRWWRGRQGTPRPAFRCEPLLVAWFVLTVAVSQTDAMASQRWLALTPLWALGVGTSLVAAGRFLVARTEFRPAMLVVAGSVLIGGIAIASAARFYDEDQQRRAYGDVRTTGAYDLGWRLAGMDDAPEVLSLGRPFQPYSGFGNLRFLFPAWSERVVEIEPLDGPDAPGVPAPVLEDDQVAVVAAERVATDWCPLAQANPDASFAEARDRYGNVLYLFVYGGDLPFTDRPTPAGSTVEPVEVRC